MVRKELLDHLLRIMLYAMHEIHEVSEQWRQITLIFEFLIIHKDEFMSDQRVERLVKSKLIEFYQKDYDNALVFHRRLFNEEI